MSNTLPGDVQSILLVDDDPFFLDLLKDVLKKKQFIVNEAKTGHEALVSITKHKPDLILLDLSLPDIHGLKIANLLKTSPYLCEIPIIVLTGDESEQTIELAYTFNVHDYLIKPINPAVLVKQIEIALNNSLIKSELQHQKTQFNEVQKLAGIGTWEYDANSSQFICSKEFYSIMDLDKGAQSVSFDNFITFSHPDFRNELKDHILDAIKNGRASSLEHLLINDSGYECLILHRISVEKSATSYDYIVTGVIMDITERRNEQNLITHTRFYDIVTGLPNRDNFCNRLNTLLLQNTKENKLLGLLFIGIDRFKNINETLGRNIGDEILIYLSKQLNVYESIELFRYTGDIFAAVITNMDTVMPAQKIADNIHKKLSEPVFINDHELYISVSIGMAYHPLISGGRDDFINCAESAMYQAKRMGSNRTRSFDKSSFKKTKTRLHIETDLRKALDKDQFEVFYQPQVTVEDNNLIGMEALVRWKHPDYGIIKPDNFISIAEDTGLIVPLGEWVIETATEQCAKWFNEGYGMMRVAINISPRQFEHTALVKSVQDSIMSSGLPACALDLEITESSAMRDINHTIKVLDQFLELGVQTSMDDFGTGYSSLSYIRKLPLKTIKIDKAFIKDISTSGANSELAEIIISMCKSFGRNIIAEGVEKLEHLNFLRDHHCNEAQGYFFSPPLKNTHFELLFNRGNSETINYKPPTLAKLDKLDSA